MDSSGNNSKTRIRVVVRKRPSNKKEVSRSDPDVVESRGPQTIVVKETKYPTLSSLFQ